MATKIIIKELNKKKDEISQFINKLENIIEQKQEEIYHIQSTLDIFNNSSQNDLQEELNEPSNLKQNPNVIEHDFKQPSQIIPDNKVSDNIKNAIKTQKQKVKKLHQDEKEILKQFKQLMRG